MVINGTTGADSLVGTLGDDVIDGLGGNDTINATEGNDQVDGGIGIDRLVISLANADRFTAATAARNFTITSSAFTELSGVINSSLAGIERITFSALGAGDFGDTLDASGFVTGPTGSFVLAASMGAGDDSVTGTAYNDLIMLGLGNNWADGGSGYDDIRMSFANSGGDTLYVTGSGGTVTTEFNGGVTNTILNAEMVMIGGTDFNAAVTTVDASGLTGFSGSLLFFDHNGSNISIGSAGSDIFANSHGAEAGTDVYTGNGGADIYDYTFAIGAMDRDTITDFDADDIIDLQFNTATQNGGGLLANQFIGNADFSGVAGQYRYFASGGQTFVEVDTSGDGLADETLTIANGEFALGETAAGSNQLQLIGISGTSGDDFLIGSKDSDDNIFGQAGNDTIAGTQGADHVDGGDGYDQLRFQAGFPDRFDPATGPRTYTITDNWIGDSSGTFDTTFSGVESLFLRTLENGDFGDIVDASGWTGDSLILRLGAGDDTVIGSAGNDDLGLNLGINTADAGAGWDIVYTAFDNMLGETAYVTSSGGAVILTVGGAQTASIVNGEQVHITGFYASGTTTTIDASGYDAIDGVQLVLRDSNGSDTIIGSTGSDYLSNVSNNTLGNDVFTGNGGADTFDYSYASSGIDGDTITDFDGDDTLDFRFNDGTVAGASPLLCTSFIGAASFSGIAGEYRFQASGGQTQIEVDTDGDADADLVLTLANGEFGLVETAAGSNMLMRANLLDDSDGDDFTVGTSGNDYIDALGGDDFIAATQGIDFVDGGEGFDQLRFIMSNAGRFTAPTESRTYTITADHVSDSSGMLDNSFVNVEQVYLNTVNAGNFGDFIDGSGASVSLALRLGNGDDVVIGGAGDDDIITGLGINSVDAGDGNDLVVGNYDSTSGATAYVTFDGSAVITTVDGVVTNSIVNAEIVGVQGSDFNAAITTVDASGLTGFSGTLAFYDHNGSNISIGHDGADIFANVHGGEAGNDVYTGNGGADIYDYTVAIGAMDGDTITDFDGDDIIDLTFNTASLNGGGLLADQFIGTAAFSNVAGQYRYFASGGQTFVEVDTNGDAVADETLTIANGQFALGETASGSNILQIVGTSGTSVNDTLTGTLGNDSIYGQQGNDIFNGSQGTDFIDGGQGGGDRLFMNTGTASLFTAATGARTYTIGANSITDSSGTLNTSFTGVERIAFSTVGNGDFDDIIDASGFVSAHGTPLDIRLGNGDNMVTGSSVTDRLFTGFGSTIADGGAGFDRGFISVDSSSAATVVITNVGGTLVTTANGVTNSFTNFEDVQVFGVGSASLTLDASGWTAIPGVQLVLSGHNGSDIMIGSAGSDYFANTTGQILGSDVYTGNGGADIYDYTYAADSMNGDTITDFDIDDVIDFRFNNLELGGSPLLCNMFIGDAAFSGTAGEYRYQIDGAQTVIQLDSNGDSVADQVVTIANGGFMLAETELGSNILTLAEPIDEAEGIISDGYLAGATLFIDVDGDQILDAGEAWTTTDGAGNFTLNVNQQGTLVAFGGTNIDTGLANHMTLAAPSGSGVVNPLTTLIQAVLDADEDNTRTIAQAQAMVLAALGLAPTLDLLNLDLIAAAATSPAALAAQKAAATIANLVAAVEGAAGAGAATEGLLIDALAELVADTPAGSAVDLTSAATLTPLLTEALPGSGQVAAIVAEAVIEGDAIAAATSIDAISTAQLSAQTIDYALDNLFTGDAAANHLFGLGGNDTLIGLGGSDILEGGIGNDRLEGGAGLDLLNGDAGLDRLIGGDGIDYLRGGANNDQFVAEITASKSSTKLGAFSFDVIFDFAAGDKIDLRLLDANTSRAGHQAFSWKSTSSNKAAGDLTFKVYDSVNGAEKALGVDIDGVLGASPYSGPVTLVLGNVDGNAPDFAFVLIGANGVAQSDFLFV